MIMADMFTKKRRSEIMSSIRSKDTRPEIVVRCLLHRLGFRFRLHKNGLPGHPDMVLPKWRSVVFVHGCFWHGCNRCDRGTRIPKTNREFWLAKVDDNRSRDQKVTHALEVAGWQVIIIWACETGDQEGLERLLSSRLHRPTVVRTRTTEPGE